MLSAAARATVGVYRYYRMTGPDIPVPVAASDAVNGRAGAEAVSHWLKNRGHV